MRSVAVVRVLAHYGFTATTKYKVPEVVWRGSEACVRGYLRALFQCDGTVQRDDPNAYCTIRLASSRPELLKQVQMLLANFGIHCRVLKRRDAGTRLLPDGKGGKRPYACQPDFELLIGSESRDRFMEEIGFLTDEKASKYREWAAQRTKSHKSTFMTSISKIEFAVHEPVFDTTQPDKNNLIFNGLVTGNCGEQPLPPYGSCLLGSINLTSFVRDPFTDEARFDWDEYHEVVRVFTRMLDNVVEVNGLPLERSSAKKSCASAVMAWDSWAWARTITMLRMKYGSREAVGFTEARLQRDGGRRLGSRARAREREGRRADHVRGIRGHRRDAAQAPGDGARRHQARRQVAGRVLHARYSRYMQRVAEVAPELVEKLAPRARGLPITARLRPRARSRFRSRTMPRTASSHRSHIITSAT